METLLDKGLVLNADIMVSVAGVELLGIRLRAALASFETASRYGLEFPAGTDTEPPPGARPGSRRRPAPSAASAPRRGSCWRSGARGAAGGVPSLEQGRAALPVRPARTPREHAGASRDGGARTAESRDKDEDKGPGGRKPSGRARSEAEAEGTGDRG
ncbi:gas vesicle protein [Streptomyces albidoflavus]